MKACCDFNTLHYSKYQNLNNLESKQNRRIKNALNTSLTEKLDKFYVFDCSSIQIS